MNNLNNNGLFEQVLQAQETQREGWMAEIPPPIESKDAFIERLKKGCQELSLALSKIDYMCGFPNEMEVSAYCVHQNEDAVVELVKTTLAAKDAEIDRLKKELEIAQLDANRLFFCMDSFDWENGFEAFPTLLDGTSSDKFASSKIAMQMHRELTSQRQ